MVVDQFTQVFGSNPVVHGLVGRLVIASLNLLGASLIFVWRNPSERAMDGALGFAAGVMLAASFTSLIIPGIETYSDGSVEILVFGHLFSGKLLYTNPAYPSLNPKDSSVETSI